MAISGSGGGGGSGGAVRAGRAFVELGTKDSGLSAGLARAKALVMGLGKVMANAQNIAAARNGIRELASHMTAAGDRALDFQRLSERIGVPVDQLSAFAYAAETTGQELGDLKGHFENFAERVYQASQGTGEAAETFKKLGINAAEFIKKNPVDQITELGDAMKSMLNDTERRGLLSALGSDQFQGLNVLLKEGSAGLAKLMEQARQDGGVLDPAETKAAADSMKELNRTWAVSKNAALALGLAILPSAENTRKFNHVLRAIIGDTKTWVSTQWEAVKAATALDEAAGGIEGHFASVGQGIGKALEKGDPAGAIKILIGSIDLQFRILVADLADLWSGFAGEFADTFKESVAAVKLAINDAETSAKKALTTTTIGQEATGIVGRGVRDVGAGIGWGWMEEMGQAALNSVMTPRRARLTNEQLAAELEKEGGNRQDAIVDALAAVKAADKEARDAFNAKAKAELDRVTREHAERLRGAGAGQFFEEAPIPREVVAGLTQQMAAFAKASRGQFGGALAGQSFGGASPVEKKLDQGNKLADEANKQLEGIARVLEMQDRAWRVTG